MAARPLLVVLLIIGIVTSAAAAWACYRFSDDVLVHDRSWPRPPPYPDVWLLMLHDWLDARYPVGPERVKLHGEIARVKLVLRAALVATIGITCAGAVPLARPWLRRLRSRRGFDVVPVGKSDASRRVTID